MPKQSKIANQILLLHQDGKSYAQIAELLKCSKGTISYHLGIGQKDKTKIRQLNKRTKNHPFQRKLENFRNKVKPFPTIFNPTYQNKQLINHKIKRFHMDRKTGSYAKPTFTLDDVISKFGSNPVCYLTGEPININLPRTYQFDHIIPVDRGGENSLDNLGLTTRLANMAKTNMTHDEFVALCLKVVEYHGYETKHKVDDEGVEP